MSNIKLPRKIDLSKKRFSLAFTSTLTPITLIFIIAFAEILLFSFLLRPAPAHAVLLYPWDSPAISDPLWSLTGTFRQSFSTTPLTLPTLSPTFSQLPIFPFVPSLRTAAAFSPPVPAPPAVPVVPLGPVGIDTLQFRYGPPAGLKSPSASLPGLPTYVNGQVVVTFLPATPPAEMVRICTVHQCREVYASPFAGFKILAIPPSATVLDMTRMLAAEPSVLYVSPNYYRHAHLLPNDPYYIYQWHLPRLNCSYAWDYSTGLGALVALIDSGVAYETSGVYAKAPDLAGTLFAPGYDFYNLDAYPDDDYGHGTHMAGCIAQTTNNLLGCSGVAFNATIMPVKVMDNLGNASVTAEVDGIYFAANNGAKIINMSLGGPGTIATEAAAVTYAYNAGVTIICSAGNGVSGIGTSVPEYPASYPQCISVSAIRYDYTLAAYSNYGQYVDVCAPGGDLTVDQNLDGFGDGILQQTFTAPAYTTFYYYFMEGTSPAAALVSGCAALVVSKSLLPLTPLQVTTTLEGSATDLGTVGWDQSFGYGLVNPYLAVLQI
jgi:serine protease